MQKLRRNNPAPENRRPLCSFLSRLPTPAGGQAKMPEMS